MKKTILILHLMISLAATAFCQQQVKVSGVVKDALGPLANATIYEKGMPGNGITTSNDGKFNLTLRGTSKTITVKSVGYGEQELKITDDKAVEVILQAVSNGLDEVVVQGFSKKKRITNTGSVSSINAAEIRNVPTANVQNTLAGRLPGFFSQQRSGQPGQDASDFFIRGVSSLNAAGNQPLIIVDDIEYSYSQLSQINVNEIENITILKDASTTAIYGIRGANGVLIVTTRRGSSGKPKVSLRVETGRQSPVRVPRFLNSYQSAILRNQALRNDGLPEEFSQTDIDLFKSGADPYIHPDVDWYSTIFKPASYQQNANFDVSGGTERVKYFISVGALNQNGSLRNFSDVLSQVNSTYLFNRYNFRSNLDIQATKTLALRLDVTERFGLINAPVAANATGEIYSYLSGAPYAAPFLNPNGTYAFLSQTPTQLPTLNARLAALGYIRSNNNDFNILLGATQKLDFITQGLSFIAKVAYASSASVTRSQYRTQGPPSYRYNADGSYTLNPQGLYTMPPLQNSAGNPLYTSNINLQGYFNYDRHIAKHHVYSLLLFNQTSRTDRAIDPATFNPILNPPVKFRGYSLRVGYDYDNKYLFEFDGAYNGSDRFEKPYGLFPAVSAGWNIAKEAFFKNASHWVQILKLRASVGLVGSDVTSGNRYLYKSLYYIGPNYYYAQGHSVAGSIYEGDLVSGSGVVTWEKELKKDIGLDANLFGDKVSVTIDYFSNRRYDQLISRQSLSAIIGIGTSPVNLGVVKNKGWDGQIAYHPNIGKVQLNLNLVFSYAKNKRVFVDEPVDVKPNLRQTGTPIGQPFGYTWIGYYTDSADIAKSAKPFPNVQPGDLKYADLNGDGKITPADQSAIGLPNLPNTTYGLTTGANYAGFSISILFQGSQGYSFSVKNSGIEPFLSTLQPVHAQAWTPQTAQTAKFPRLTTISEGINSNDAFPSSFYLINAKYLRLKTLEFGYQLPQRALPLKINNARLYISCYNLFTWTNYSLYQQDPEVTTNTAGDAYLNQRVINVGLQVGF